MSRFIPITQFNSVNIDSLEHILFVNTNAIAAFSHMKSSDDSTNDCLLVKLNNFVPKDTGMPREFKVCKKTNPIAYNELMYGC